MTRSILPAVPVLMISPNGHMWPHASLKMAASFISFMTERITGDKKFCNHHYIRFVLEHGNGEIDSGVMSGWQVIAFKTNDEMHAYMSDRLGYPSHRIKE